MFTYFLYYSLVGIVIVVLTPVRKQILESTKQSKYEPGQSKHLYKNLVLHTMVFTVGILLWPVLLLKWLGILTKQIKSNPSMIKQPFYGELYVEDKQLGKKSLYINVFIDVNDHVVIQLHNAPPPFSINTWIGNYGSRWLLKKVKTRLLVTVFEITLLEENETVKARCLTGHKFGRMIEEAISTQAA